MKFSAKILVILVLGICVFTVWFAQQVKTVLLNQVHANTINNPVFHSPYDKMVYAIASIPENAKTVVLSLLQGGSVTGEAAEFAITLPDNSYVGFTHVSANPEDISGYLLISQWNRNDNRFRIELFDTATGKRLRSWAPDIDAINRLSKIDRTFVKLEESHNVRRHPLFNPLLLDDGSIIFSGSGAPLLKMDACSNLIWQLDGWYHHSIEPDPDGKHVWSGIMHKPGKFAHLHEFYQDDGIARVDMETGALVFEKSVTEILFDNGLEHLLETAYIDYDPIHLNDIQPIATDGPFWQKDDLFLSLRAISTVLLYRPSTNKVIWWQQGPWVMQHDVDIVDDHTISLFNNNNIISDDKQTIRILSKTMWYDFNNNTLSTPYKKLFAKEQIRSLTGGLSTLVEGGDIVVEENDRARVIRGDKEGNVKWRYQWDGYICWSRFLLKAQYEPIITKLEATSCNP